VAVFDGTKQLSSSAVSTTELGYVSGVTSAVQTQLNGKLSLIGGTMIGPIDMGVYKITSSYTPITGVDITNKTYVDSAISGAGSLFVPKIGPALLSNTFEYTSAVPILFSGLSGSKALITNASKQLAESATTSTELGYVSGVSSNIQTQINSKASTASLASYVPYSGANQNIDVGSNKIKTTGIPSFDNDLTNKLYVDTLIVGRIPRSGDTTLISDFFTTGYWRCSGKMECGGLFSNTNIGINQSFPQWKIHASNTNAWNVSVGGYNANKANGIMALGGKDNNPDYQYIIYPNPSQSDGGVAGMAWWSCDMITGRYKNEYRLAWWKETHGTPLGAAYKEGITLYLTDAGGFNNLDYINFNGNTKTQGTSTTYGTIQAFANGAGGPSMIYSENQVTGDGYAVFHLRNDSGTGAYWFLNSSGRTSDGGANGATLRNDIGKLHLQSQGGNGFTIEPTTGYTLKYGGDSSKILFGPNATWGAYLVVGAGDNEVTTTKAQIISTNGNLHIDSATNHGLYLNYYTGGASYIFSYTPWEHNGSMNIIGGRLCCGNFLGRSVFAIADGATAGTFGNISAWPNNANGMLISETTPQNASSAGLFTGFRGDGGYITCLAPGVAWRPLYHWTEESFWYVYGSLASYITSSGWINVSDEREKEDIQDIKTASSLKRVMALKPKHYRRKFYDEKNPVPDSVKQTRHVGFLAQEVQQTNPHCISGWCNDEVKTEEDDGTRLGIHYNDFVVHLIGAVQEQQKQIDTLTQRNEVLESHARQQGKAFTDYKKQTSGQIEKLASLIGQLMSK
jgi:hypothetical protein